MKWMTIVIFMLLISCNIGDPDLNRSIFIRDKQYRDLPQYSEWGYNTFGAYIDEDVFVSGLIYEAASLYRTDTLIRFELPGEKHIQRSDTIDMMMTFLFTWHHPADPDFLVALNDSVIDLSAPTCRVLITTHSQESALTVSTGNIHFKKIRKLFIDNESKETIVSGTFEFSGMIDGSPVHVTLGRFDEGV
jgi:hypothetical protein